MFPVKDDPSALLAFSGEPGIIDEVPKTGRVYVNQSVSFPPGLLAAAKKRAGNLGLAFSTYVQKCVERDISERAPIVFQEVPGGRRLVAEDPPSGGSPGGRAKRP